MSGTPTRTMTVEVFRTTVHPLRVRQPKNTKLHMPRVSRQAGIAFNYPINLLYLRSRGVHIS